MEIITGVGIGLIVGGVLAFIIQNVLLKRRKEQILKDAENEGEAIKKDKIIQAKEKFLQLKENHDKVIRERERKLQSAEDRAKAKDKNLSKKIEEVSRKERRSSDLEKALEEKIQINLTRQEELERIQEKRVAELSRISGMNPEEAKVLMMKALTDEARTQAMADIKDIVEEAKLNANTEAKRVIIQAMQRIGTEQAIENAVSVFNIESDDIKGRIIGREGRNIRAIEAATGVEIIVDDTPEAIILSCFDPIRREIARLSLHKLVTDGRIHPARIEEVVAKTTKQIDDEIIEVGKKTVMDLGIHGLHKDLVKTVGRMKYRSSYGQNLLHHSREVAKLCGIMAAELGLNAKMAKRAGLLHDI